MPSVAQDRTGDSTTVVLSRCLFEPETLGRRAIVLPRGGMAPTLRGRTPRRPLPSRRPPVATIMSPLSVNRTLLCSLRNLDYHPKLRKLAHHRVPAILASSLAMMTRSPQTPTLAIMLDRTGTSLKSQLRHPHMYQTRPIRTMKPLEDNLKRAPSA